MQAGATEGDDHVRSTNPIDAKLASFIDLVIVPLIVEQFLIEYNLTQQSETDDAGQFHFKFSSGAQAA